MRDEYAQYPHRDEAPLAESFFSHAYAERGPLEAAPGNAKLKIENWEYSVIGASPFFIFHSDVVGAGHAREHTQRG